MTRNLIPERFVNRAVVRFPQFLTNLFDEDFLAPSEAISGGGISIYEEGNQLHVDVPLPGLSSSDIDVSLSKGVLIIRGEVKSEEEDKKRKYYRSSQRSYSYSVALPIQTDESKEPQAVYENGILKVLLQISKQAETKKISVKAGNSKK